MARTKWKCAVLMPRSKKPCGKSAVTALYCREHMKKRDNALPVFTVGKRSKVVVNRLLRRLRRRKPCYLILTEHFPDRKLRVDSHGWVSMSDSPDSTKFTKNLGKVTKLLKVAGYEIV